MLRISPVPQSICTKSYLMLYSSKANMPALSSWLAVLGSDTSMQRRIFLWITPLRRLDCGSVVWLGLSPSGRTCLSCGFSSQPPCNTQPALCKPVTFGMISVWLDLFWNTGWQKGFPFELLVVLHQAQTWVGKLDAALVKQHPLACDYNRR